MKKIVVWFLVFLFCFHLGVFGFDDISDETMQSSVDTLAEFQIINGYEDGTFKPDKNITRAEFSKIIINTIAYYSELYNAERVFDDVPDDYWATEYICKARQLSIINGTTATTFEPGANITYEQAIKMIVVGLGYDTEAKEKGGYPGGYIQVANELGILSGVDFENTDMAARGNIALIIRKALDVPYYNFFIKEDGVVWTKAEGTLYKYHQELDAVIG